MCFGMPVEGYLEERARPVAQEFLVAGKTLTMENLGTKHLREAGHRIRQELGIHLEGKYTWFPFTLNQELFKEEPLNTGVGVLKIHSSIESCPRLCRGCFCSRAIVEQRPGCTRRSKTRETCSWIKTSDSLKKGESGLLALSVR